MRFARSPSHAGCPGRFSLGIVVTVAATILAIVLLVLAWQNGW